MLQLLLLLQQAGETAEITKEEITDEAVVSAVAPASIFVATTKEDGATAETTASSTISAVAPASFVVATTIESEKETESAE